MTFRSLSSVLRLLSVAALVALTSCAIPSAADQDAPLTLSNDQTYNLSEGDTVRLSISNDDRLTGEYIVDQRGSITVPMIGEIEAKGLSKESLGYKIQDTFTRKGILEKPLVTVDVTAMRPIFILGEVKTPGSYPYRPSLTVFKAIALAGGYTQRAAQNKVLIDRGEGTDKKRLNAIEDTPLMPGDSITVRERIF